MAGNRQLLDLYEAGKFDELGEALRENVKRDILRRKRNKPLLRQNIVDTIFGRSAAHMLECHRGTYRIAMNSIVYNCWTDSTMIVGDSTTNYDKDYPTDPIDLQHIVDSYITPQHDMVSFTVDNLNLHQSIVNNESNYIVQIKLGISSSYIALNTHKLEQIIDFTESNSLWVSLDETRVVDTYISSETDNIVSPVICISQDKNRFGFLLPMRLSSTFDTYQVSQTVLIQGLDEQLSLFMLNNKNTDLKFRQKI